MPRHEKMGTYICVNRNTGNAVYGIALMRFQRDRSLCGGSEAEPPRP